MRVRAIMKCTHRHGQAALFGDAPYSDVKITVTVGAARDLAMVVGTDTACCRAITQGTVFLQHTKPFFVCGAPGFKSNSHLE